VLESASRNEAWDVFQEHERGSHAHDEPKEIRPEPAFVFDPFLQAGTAPRLTGESGNDAIHFAAERSAVEGFEIVPDRSAIQGLVAHPRHESSRSVGVPLDVTHAAGANAEVFEPRAKPFAEHADAGAGFEIRELGTCSHIHASVSAK
jgi:hypothetical protein